MAATKPESRSGIMRSIRSKNTKPEMAVRRAAHGMGLRYRLHRTDLPGKPDLVFPRHGVVVFIHGCFWHQHPDESCLDAHRPRSNQAYWNEKLLGNVGRDRNARRDLESLGWDVHVIW